MALHGNEAFLPPPLKKKKRRCDGLKNVPVYSLLFCFLRCQYLTSFRLDLPVMFLLCKVTSRQKYCKSWIDIFYKKKSSLHEYITA